MKKVLITFPSHAPNATVSKIADYVCKIYPGSKIMGISEKDELTEIMIKEADFIFCFTDTGFCANNTMYNFVNAIKTDKQKLIVAGSRTIPGLHMGFTKEDLQKVLE